MDEPKPDAFLALYEAVAACEAPKGTQVDDVLAEFQQLYDERRNHVARPPAAMTETIYLSPQEES